VCLCHYAPRMLSYSQLACSRARWNVLRTCATSAKLPASGAADWEAVASAARRTRQTAALAVTALLVRDYFGSAVPESIRVFSARGWRVPWLARRASRHLLENLRVGTARAASPTIAWSSSRPHGILAPAGPGHPSMRP